MSASHGKPNTGVAIVGVAIGVVYLAIAALQGKWGTGIAGVVIVIGYTALMYGLRARSEPAQLLSGMASDERQAVVMQRASAVTGQLLIGVILAAMCVSMVVQSRYTTVFVGLAAIAGAAFVGSTVYFSRRS